MIDRYEFGRIEIDGNIYKNDIIICPDKIISDWWRKSGHYLRLEDFQNLLDEIKPEIVIIGTGKFGVMKVSPEVKQYLKNKGIKFFIQASGKAADLYNKKINLTDRIIGAFHLTC